MSKRKQCDCEATDPAARHFKVIRFFFRNERHGKRNSRTVKSGLTLAEAQAHCGSPETSSTTAKSAQARRRTESFGPWFDGYDHA